MLEEMVTTRPYRRAIIDGMTARARAKVARRLTLITRSHSSSGVSTMRCGCPMPALLTRISTGPKASCERSTNARHWSISPTSA